jgi:hypothetical protein
MKSIYLFATLFILFACASRKQNNTSSPSAIAVTKVNFETPKKKSDPFQINAVRVDKNELILDVEYGGGCKDHVFELYANPSIEKSNPPKRSIQIIHENNNDMCRAIVHKTIRFQIDELAYNQEKGSKIKLNLAGWDAEIPFTLH